MSDTPGALPAELAAQLAEAARDIPAHDFQVETKTVTWRGAAWQVRAKPGARFLDSYEHERLMAAAHAVLGDDQYAKLLDIDPDIEGDDGVEGFFAACNTVWGVDSGN